ncbi:MAG: transposase zinc-binding domain-containing protein, partial [Deltaproteobacteria bacterium]|nr:transposase zinc-binding domain-containing protein [Deltaproteobacteria bacterium]
MLVHPAARPTPSYVPRARAKDLLYQILQQHLATFLERAREHDRPVPGHVERELFSYLACGIPAHGFALLRCDACDGSHVVPFSCKGRGFCPSCGGRWMSQTAAHLVDRVFPEVPVRQWVLTLPMPLRFWLARRPRLCREVLGVFLRAVFGWYRKRALAVGVADGRCGAVTFAQSFGSALNLNLHFHALVTDGVYAWDQRADEPVFHPVRGLSTEDVEELVEVVRHRILRPRMTGTGRSSCKRLPQRAGSPWAGAPADARAACADYRAPPTGGPSGAPNRGGSTSTPTSASPAGIERACNGCVGTSPAHHWPTAAS